jgi:hypothetical protein
MIRVHVYPKPEEREQAKADLAAFVDGLKANLLAAVDRGQCVSIEHEEGKRTVYAHGMLAGLAYTGGRSCAFVIEPDPRPRRRRPDLDEAVYAPKPDEPVVVENTP